MPKRRAMCTSSGNRPSARPDCSAMTRRAESRVRCTNESKRAGATSNARWVVPARAGGVWLCAGWVHLPAEALTPPWDTLGVSTKSKTPRAWSGPRVEGSQVHCVGHTQRGDEVATLRPPSRSARTRASAHTHALAEASQDAASATATDTAARPPASRPAAPPAICTPAASSAVPISGATVSTTPAWPTCVAVFPAQSKAFMVTDKRVPCGSASNSVLDAACAHSAATPAVPFTVPRPSARLPAPKTAFSEAATSPAWRSSWGVKSTTCSRTLPPGKTAENVTEAPATPHPSSVTAPLQCATTPERGVNGKAVRSAALVALQKEAASATASAPSSSKRMVDKHMAGRVGGLVSTTSGRIGSSVELPAPLKTLTWTKACVPCGREAVSSAASAPGLPPAGGSRSTPRVSWSVSPRFVGGSSQPSAPAMSCWDSGEECTPTS